MADRCMNYPINSFNCAFYENELRILSEDDEGKSFSACKLAFKDLDGDIYNITGFDKGE